MGVAGGGAGGLRVRTRFSIGLAAVLAIAIGSALVAALVYSGDRNDFHDMQREEALRAAHQAEAVAALSVGQLATAAAFYQADEDISRHEFQTVGRSLLGRGALSATALIRVVPADRRAHFERAYGVPIIERSPVGPQAAALRPVYYPVAYAAYKRFPSKVLGFDVGSDPVRAAALSRARDSGHAVATDTLSLVLGGSGINVFRPIYRDGAATDSVAERRRALVGFAGGSFRVSDLAAAAVAALPADDTAQLRIGDQVVLGPAGELDDPATASIHIADRTWVLAVRNPGAPGLGLPSLVAGIGIALAALLGALIFVWSRNERMQELERQASQDALTGLANRRRFEEDLRATIARCRRDGTKGALLIIDLDDFKAVNDAQGHPAGDRLIEEIATVLRGRTRAGDSLARLGGDEFAVILPRSGRREATVVAEAIATAIREHRLDGGDEPVSASIGISLFGGGDEVTGPATAIARADAAMYAAKEAGRDAVRIFDGSTVAGEVSR
ncbi:MAG TPA: diguanylate cyclase [Solirubrobacterales bacterium]|nr:diguanylate cyclase [Solirubrobacterales bacterium]